jgi:hypothetical protein
LEGIKLVADLQPQTDISFKITRSYSRVNVRRQLIEQQSCQDGEFPSPETVQHRLNEMGYTLKQSAKAKPQKRLAEIDVTSE